MIITKKSTVFSALPVSNHNVDYPKTELLSLALIRYGLCVLADLFVEERDCVVLFYVSRKILKSVNCA